MNANVFKFLCLVAVGMLFSGCTVVCDNGPYRHPRPAVYYYQPPPVLVYPSYGGHYYNRSPVYVTPAPDVRGLLPPQ